MALIHPRWRRVLGFAWFDDDPALIAGAVYEYRVTGGFPAIDLDHRVAGLHTVPSQTALPPEWYFGGVRLRFPQPRVVDRAAPDNGARRQITRRGVRLEPKSEPWWAVPSLDDWSLVIDFPDAVSSVTLDVEPGHDLKFAAGAAWLPPSGTSPLPPGPRARIDFAAPIHQLLLAGHGFLESIRIPTATVPLTPEVRPVSALTAPTPLIDAPLPDPPLVATVANLQQAQPVLTIDLPTTPTPHPHELGFEVRWRPAPRAGVGAWAPESDGAGAARCRAVPGRASASRASDNAIHSGHRRRRQHHPRRSVVQDGDAADPSRRGSADLFPEVRPSAAGAVDLFWRDVFDFTGDGGGSAGHAAAAAAARHTTSVPGSRRRSDRPAECGMDRNRQQRLEKHTPPPLPAGPDLTSAERAARTGDHGRPGAGSRRWRARSHG